MDYKNKVFGIGFHKTATTTLAVALYILGYNVTGYFGTDDQDIDKNVYDTAFQLADRFNAAQDTPWPVLYKELDKRYPNSKFVLTVRDPDKWIKSVVKHFKKHRIPTHEWIYGVPTAKGYENVYLQRYEAHNREVLSYFINRPNDLLVMDITKGDGWDKLCGFLGHEIPLITFPVQNTSTEKSRKFFQRSIRYLNNRIIPSYLLKEKKMRQGVSSAFVHDVIHYHYEMFETIWHDLESIDNQQFMTNFAYSESSIQDLFLEQLSVEKSWLRRLEHVSLIEPIQPMANMPRTKEEVKRAWESNQSLVREFIANMSDEACNARLPDGEGIVWEAFMDIMTLGTEKRLLIRKLLESFAVEVKRVSFVDFFNGQKQMSY